MELFLLEYLPLERQSVAAVDHLGHVSDLLDVHVLAFCAEIYLRLAAYGQHWIVSAGTAAPGVGSDRAFLAVQ